MGQLLTPETFEFFARYLLAGFVFMSARSRFVAGERPRINETLVESLILSLINQMVALLTFAGATQDWSAANPSLRLFLEVVVQPAFLGLLTGWLSVRNWLPAGLRRLIMPAVRPVLPAVDYAFDRLEAPAYVILTFEDGRQVFGFFGSASMVSTDTENGGMFIEDIYSVSGDGVWTPADPGRGAWVAMSRLRSIEFIGSEEL